jgi:glucose/arabinose dehydrogenase
MKLRIFFLLMAILFHAENALAVSAVTQNILNNLKLPAGFKISAYAENIPKARAMALGDNGIVFVGSTDAGKVYALQDANRDNVAEKVYVIAQGLKLPTGVAYRNGSLYVGSVDRILRYDNIVNRLSNPPAPVTVTNTLPKETHHGWRYLRFGPDGKLYVSIGAPCNICDITKAPFLPMHGTIVRMNPDGTGREIIIKGVRNSVGFDWNPQNNALFFTDNGRDWLGDTIPYEELNRWSGAPGQHFGYPFCHAGTVLDETYGAGKNCSQFTAPSWRFGAHQAPLGIHFYKGTKFPSQYNNGLFVAFHGSWNRTPPAGYRVALLKVSSTNYVTYGQDFISGWLTSAHKKLGRPVDILALPDGSLLISDDWASLVYRVTYQ